MSKKMSKTANLITAGAIATFVLIFLVTTETDKKSQENSSPQQPSRKADVGSTPKTTSPSATTPQATSSQPRLESDVLEQASNPTFKKPLVPNELPEEMKQQLTNPPPELPEDLKAQLNAPPPELPEDLKRQLDAPPPDLPPDLKAQLEAPPPEIPEDIKRALETPPRVVSLDEVNNPPPRPPE